MAANLIITDSIELPVQMAMAGGEIGRSLSQMLKQTSKLDVLALYDVAASNKTFSSIPPRFHSFSNGEPLNTNVSILFASCARVLDPAAGELIVGRRSLAKTMIAY